MNKRITLFAALFFVLLCQPSFGSDIAVTSVKITYKDDITTPGKVVVRELKSLQDDTFWSKPETVDVTVEILNQGQSAVNYISVSPQLYYKVTPAETGFPPMKRELRTITKGPVWVWIRTLGSKPLPEILPGRKETLIFENLDVRNEYYATDYIIHAFAIRVFAEPRDRDTDTNLNNNVKEKIVLYGD